jgi:predicted TIM-barrel fold metal-dependent hydrolase
VRLSITSILDAGWCIIVLMRAAIPGRQIGVPDDIVDRVRVIDCDTHVIEPYDLWTSRLSVSKWGDYVPHVKWDDATQKDQWYFGDSVVWHAAGSAMAGFDGYPPDQPRRLMDAEPYTWDSKQRLRAMDDYGIYAQVLYPNVSGFGMGKFFALKEPELMLACVRAYNDFLSDFSAIAPERFLPISALPFWDIEASCAEMSRCAAMGHRGIILASQPEIFGLPGLAHPHWHRLFEVAQDMQLPVNFHIAAGDSRREERIVHHANGAHANMAKTAVMLFLGAGNAVAEIIVSGLCHRYPRLNFVSVESGVGWIPFLLDALDWQWKNCGVRQEHPEYELLPSEYFRRQIFGCFWFEDRTAKDALAALGPDNILYETDFPHPTSMAPGPKTTAVRPRDFISEHLADIPESSLEKILFSNAARLYGVK